MSVRFKTLRVGYAGELFAAYRLTLEGFEVSFAPPGSGYDLLISCPKGVFKVQVKTCNVLEYRKELRYHFKTQDFRTQSLKDCDIYAFVSIHSQQIWLAVSNEVKSNVRFDKDTPENSIYDVIEKLTSTNVNSRLPIST